MNDNDFRSLDYSDNDPAIERLDIRKHPTPAHEAYDVLLYSPDSIDEICIGVIRWDIDQRIFSFFPNNTKLPITPFRLLQIHDIVIRIDHAKRFNKTLL